MLVDQSVNRNSECIPRRFCRSQRFVCCAVLQLETQTMISGRLDYKNKEKLQEFREKFGDVERMFEDPYFFNRSIGQLLDR